MAAKVKAPDDKPTIGLLLAKQQNRLVAEYALSGIDKPIGVAQYQLLPDLPDTLEKSYRALPRLKLNGRVSWGRHCEETTVVCSKVESVVAL